MATIKRTNTITAILVMLNISVDVPASAQCKLTLAEAVHEALEANQALVAARQTLDAQQKDVMKARSTMLPSLGFKTLGQFSKNRTFSDNAGVIPAQVLLVGGLLNQKLYDQTSIDALGAQKHVYESQQLAFENTRNQTIAEVGQDYVGVLLAAALMALQQQNVGLSQSALELVEAQEGSGEVPYRNVLRMRSQTYEAEQQLVAQKSSLLQSRFGFNQVRNRPAEEACVLEPLTVDKDGFIFSSPIVTEGLADDVRASVIRDYLVSLGLDRSPILRSLDAQVDAQRRRMKSSRRWLIPRLDSEVSTVAFALNGGDGSDVTQDNDVFWQFGLWLSWNVLDGGAFIAAKNQNKAEFWSLRSQRNNAATSVEQSIRETAASAMASFERIGLAALQAQTASDNYVLVNEAYLDGESTLLDLIDAQDQLVRSNTAARQALYQFLSDLLILEQSISYFPFMEADAEVRVRDLEAKLRK